MIQYEYREFLFSNGITVQARYQNNVGILVVNNQQSASLNGVYIASRQGILSVISKALNLDSKVKIVRECYYCRFTPSNTSKTVAEIQAFPKSAKHINMRIAVNGTLVFRGTEQISFESIKGMQELALKKLQELEKKPKSNPNDMTLGLAQ